MKQAVVIGLGRFGLSVAKTLSEHGWDILAVDRDLERIQEVRDIVTHAVQANAQEERTLRALGVKDLEVGIVSVGDDMEASILITMLLKDLGVKEVIAKAVTDTHAKVLERVGADRIVFPEREMGNRLATSLVTPDIFELINLAGNYSIVELNVPDQYVNKSLRELDIRGKYGVVIIGVKKHAGGRSKVNLIPEPDYVFQSEDTLIVIGAKESIEKLT